MKKKQIVKKLCALTGASPSEYELMKVNRLKRLLREAEGAKARNKKRKNKRRRN